jgi:ATP-dependent DNA helicase RecG
LESKKFIDTTESETLEWKSSLAQLNRIIETISAFSNTKGGTIIIGVGGTGKSLGITIGKDTIEQITNKMISNTEPKIYPDISVKKIEGKSLIIIKVDKYPYDIVLAFGRPYKRVGKSTLKMSKDEYEKIILEKNKSKLYFDSHICKEANFTDIDHMKIKRFLERASFERRLDINPDIDPKEALEKLSLIKQDKLTNGAILLFGNNPQKFFLQAETKCARFKGVEPLEFIDMKVFGGNIIDQREDALEFLKEHIKLHAEIKGTERVERWEYPIEALREAITNAICHRNYNISRNVQIRIFDDRIEVWGCDFLPNPLTIEDLKKKHDSVLRNPLIGKCFFLIKYIEQWGTGTNRMIEKCLNYGLPEPLFEEISGNLVVTFRKYNISEEIVKSLTKEEKIIIDYLVKEKKINRKIGLQILKVSKSTLFRVYKSLEDKDLIKKEGKGKNIYYILA